MLSTRELQLRPKELMRSDIYYFLSESVNFGKSDQDQRSVYVVDVEFDFGVRVVVVVVDPQWARLAPSGDATNPSGSLLCKHAIKSAEFVPMIDFLKNSREKPKPLKNPPI